MRWGYGSSAWYVQDVTHFLLFLLGFKSNRFRCGKSPVCVHVCVCMCVCVVLEKKALFYKLLVQFFLFYLKFLLLLLLLLLLLFWVYLSSVHPLPPPLFLLSMNDGQCRAWCSNCGLVVGRTNNPTIGKDV